MNVEIGTKTPLFLFWEYLFRNFGILSLHCGSTLGSNTDVPQKSYVDDGSKGVTNTLQYSPPKKEKLR
jgi:hypothetical protein